MIDREMPRNSTEPPRRNVATMALWVFVVVEAVMLAFFVWHTLGGAASR